MNKEYFTDNISDERLAKLIDKTLNFEKNKKTKNITPHLLKAIPAVAAIVLIIGAINILPAYFSDKTANDIENIEEIEKEVINSLIVGTVSTDNPEQTSTSIDKTNIDVKSDAKSYDELIKNIYDAPILVEKTYTDISDITLNLIVDNVVVLKGEDSVKIKYYQWTDNEYTLSDDGKGSLTLQYAASYNDNWYEENWGWVNAVLEWDGWQINPEDSKSDRRTVEITVPKNMTLQSLNIDVALGNIAVSDCDVKTINTRTGDGETSIGYCTNGEDYTAVCGQNGNVLVYNCDVAKLNLNAVIGSINIVDCTSGQGYISVCENGPISVENCDAKRINTKTGNGDIYIGYCNNVQDYTAVCNQNGNVTVENCTIESVLIRAVIGGINIQDSKINTVTLERNINADMTFAPNTEIGPVTILNSTIKSVSASMVAKEIYIQESNIATFKLNDETFNSVQDMTINTDDTNISKGITTATVTSSKFRTPSEIADLIGDKTLSESFKGENVINTSESIYTNGYTYSLLAIMTGKNLKDQQNVRKKDLDERTYLMFAIQHDDKNNFFNEDGSVKVSDIFGAIMIKGYKPWQLNSLLLRSSSTYGIMADGIMYCIIECDTVEIFADRGLYFLVCRGGSIYDYDAIIYDEETGEISANPEYDGPCAVFELPIDKSLGDPKKAEQYLRSNSLID